MTAHATFIIAAPLTGPILSALPELEGEQPERIAAARVTADAFDLLGVQPALGRGFLAGEDESGRSDVVVLPYRHILVQAELTNLMVITGLTGV